MGGGREEPPRRDRAEKLGCAMGHTDCRTRAGLRLVLGERVSPLETGLQRASGFESRGLGTPDVVAERSEGGNGVGERDEAARGARDLEHGAKARKDREVNPVGVCDSKNGR